MRVKVGANWYRAEPGQPIAVELSEADRTNIANMAPDATRYATIDDRDGCVSMPELMLDWLKEG